MSSVLPKLSERDFMEQVTQLAEIRGWSWAHFRPAQTAKGWRTPVSGPLGKGWPDLFMCRPRDSRFLFVELKAKGRRLTVEQSVVKAILATTAGDQYARGIEVFTWEPSDWDRIEETLR